MLPRKFRHILAISLVLVAFSNAGLSGQKPAIPGLRASLGYAGYVVADRWMPLFFELQSAPADSYLEIRRSSQANGPAIVERIALRGAHKIEIPLFVDARARNVTVSLTLGNSLLSQQHLSPLSKVFNGHIILSSGLSEREQKAIGQILAPSEPVLVIDWTGHAWPISPLSLDAISAIVQRGDNSPLNPAQAAARQAWERLGGKTIIPPPEPISDAGKWQALLRLPPFVMKTQIPFVSLLGKDLSPDLLPPSRDISDNPLIPQALWWLIPMAVACLFKKWLFRILLPIIAASWVWLAATGADPSLSWQRGSSLFTRVVALPQSSAYLVSAVAGYPTRGRGGVGVLDQSPWGIQLGLDKGLATAAIIPNSPRNQILTSASPSGGWHLRGDTDNSLHLVKVLQASSIDQKTTIAKLESRIAQTPAKAMWRCRWQGIQLEFSQKDSSGAWQKLESPPPELQIHQGWLRSLARSTAGASWELGISAELDIGLALGQKTSFPLLWARPAGGMQP